MQNIFRVRSSAQLGRRSLVRSFQSKASQSLAALQGHLKISEEVQDAVATNKPVVALESTIYTHGSLGDLGLEDIVRKNGGVPAVCGILAGVPTVGLLPEEIDRMVHESARKASRRDISTLVGLAAVGKKIHGGTTIAGTMLLASLAGIRVFGTGGLGGVHRGGQDTLDISADLSELGRTRVAVVASGPKGFLDIPRTLEYLETQGVVVSTFARGRDPKDVVFPAFWARDSQVKSPSVIESEEEAAAIILAQEQLGIESGLLFANPIPEEASIPRAEMDAIIEQAVSEAARQAANGNENTPFLLRRIRELSQDRSTAANTALVRSNVECATKISVALSGLISGGKLEATELRRPHPSAARASQISLSTSSSSSKPKECKRADILVAGSVALDLACDYHGSTAGSSESPLLHTSNPGSITQSVGGVGRNVALAAQRASMGKVRLCSMVGDDLAGSIVLKSLESTGMDTRSIRKLDQEAYPNGKTAQYVAINNSHKDLVMAIADMEILQKHHFTEYWESTVAEAKPKWLAVDACWSASGIRNWISAAKKAGAKVGFEPVSQAKSMALFDRSAGPLQVFPSPSVDLASPNQYELGAMYNAALKNGYFKEPRWETVMQDLDMYGVCKTIEGATPTQALDFEALQQALHLLAYIPTMITKLGADGAVFLQLMTKDDQRLEDRASQPFIIRSPKCSQSELGGVYARVFPSVTQVNDVVSVNGVGDTFLGVLLAGLTAGHSVENIIDVAQMGAVMTLKSAESVSPSLSMLRDRLVATGSK